MKIAIEAQRIFRKRIHGMDIVVLEMLRKLQKLDTVNEYVVLVGSDEDRCLQETPTMKIIIAGPYIYPLWEQITLPRLVKRIKPDFLHCTSNTAPLHCSVPLVLTLHDVIFLDNQNKGSDSLYQKFGNIYRALIVRRIYRTCLKIITVSHKEEQEIINTLQIQPSQIQVVYNGVSTYFKYEPINSRILRKYIEEPGYILIFGNTATKKNTTRMIKAYSQYLKHSSIKRKLLLCDFSEEQFNALIEKENLSNIRKQVVLSGYIKNTELPQIYSSAFVFVYTSLYESFGIPQLEAMACRTPVITSNTSAMPEIAGEKATLVNPYNVDEIVGALIKLEKDDQYYKEQQDYGEKRAKLFSWHNTAKEILQIYEQLEAEGFKPKRK